jgi:hypothetical protein
MILVRSGSSRKGAMAKEKALEPIDGELAEVDGRNWFIRGIEPSRERLHGMSLSSVTQHLSESWKGWFGEME